MAQTVLIIVVFFYFIQAQTTFSKVTKWRFFLLPLFAVYSFFNNLATDLSVGVFLGVALVSILIGLYQSRSLQVVVQKEPKYYVEIAGTEEVIYQKGTYSQGGHNYIIGWLFAFIFQLLIANYYHTGSDAVAELLHDLLQEMISVFRLTDPAGTWYAWEIYLFSSFSYLYFATLRSPQLKRALFQKK